MNTKYTNGSSIAVIDRGTLESLQTENTNLRMLLAGLVHPDCAMIVRDLTIPASNRILIVATVAEMRAVIALLQGTPLTGAKPPTTNSF